MINRLLNKWIDFVRDHIYVITILISASLIGLLLIQFNLIKLEIDLQRHQFSKEIDKVLEDMKHIIKDDEELSNQLIALIGDKVHPDSTRDSLEKSLAVEIRGLTDSVLMEHGLAYLDYDFAFYQRIEDTIAFSTAIEPHQPDFQRYAIYPGGSIREAYGKKIFRFGFLFYNKSLFIAYQIFSILVITSIFIAILLGSFFSTFLVLKRQKQLSQLKNDFINNLTHELKTPIFASSLILKIIKEKKYKFSSSTLDYHISLLEKENHQLKNKVEKVLELTVLERENPGLNWQETDIHEIIHQKTGVYQILISAKNGNLNYKLGAEKSSIFGDPMHIGNILDNLLDNAIKYSENAPEIGIYTYNEDDDLVLEISDKGMGIDSKNLPYIFDKFYRVSHGNLHQTKGFGLGLSYVKMMTELHGGKITFASRVGEGSTITLNFPLYQNNKTGHYASKNIIS
ncbi:MAG: HAMP domain-containing sensor histidine kinase [Anditalea sp.]